MEDEQLITLARDAVAYWRRLFHDLDVEHQTFKSKPFYLEAPLQIEIFRFHIQPLGISNQLWVFSQFRDRDDLEVASHSIEGVNAEKQVTQILEDQRFSRQVDASPEFNIFPYAEKTFTLRQAVAEGCESALRVLRHDALNVIWGAPRYGGGSGQYQSESLWCWLFTEDPSWETLKREIDSSITQIRQTKIVPAAEPPVAAPYQEPKYDLLGSYLFPPVWVSEKPKPSVRQLLLSGMYGYEYEKGHSWTIIYDGRLDGTRFLVTQEGLLAQEIQNKRLFLNLFNTVVAILDLCGHEFLTLRKDELMQLRYESHTSEIRPSLYKSNEARLMPWLFRDFFTQVVSLESLKQAFETYGHLGESKLKQIILFFGYAISHFHQKEYSQSILWSWILAERWISIKWEEKLEKEGIRAEVVKALNEIDVLRDMKVLTKLGILDADTKKNLDWLREIRNKVAHRGDLATEEQAKQAILTSKKLLEPLL